MSKTKKNGVSPDRLFQLYGADTVHTAILFLGPPDNDIEYDERGVQGVHRFLRRVWDTALERMDGIGNGPRFRGGQSLADPWKSVRRKTHEILRRTTDAFETHTFSFNTCIAGCMEVLNELRDAGEPQDETARSVCRETLDLLVNMLSPFSPHICEELWRALGHEEATLFRVPWPTVDPEALVVDEVEIAIQVNGKVRGRALVPRGLDENGALAAARGIAPVQAALQGKQVRRAIWIPDKILNIVAT
jgi:leucyl-tRNA synthetase